MHLINICLQFCRKDSPRCVRSFTESDFATVENTDRLGARDTPEYLVGVTGACFRPFMYVSVS